MEYSYYDTSYEAAEAERKARIAQKAPFLGKWLWLLFLLVIPGIIANILTNESITEWFPFLNLPGQILNTLCIIAYGLILLKLSAENDHYRTAAICSFVATAISVIVTCISGNSQETWTAILSLPAAIIAIVSEYHEYKGHEEVLSGVNNELAEKWYKLWKWYIGIFIAFFASILVVLIIPILGLLVMLAASIGMIVIGIIKLVYLYRSSKIFRDFQQLSSYPS